MSVNIEHYIIKGIKLDWKLFKDNFNDDFDLHYPLHFQDNPEGKLGILYDGMGEQYIIAGKCLVFGDSYDGFSLTKIETLPTEEEQLINSWLKENNLDWMAEDYQLETYIVSHAC